MYDARKIKVLRELLMKQETRGRDGSRKKLILLFISYALPGIFLPLLLYKQNSDPTGFQYSFLTFLFFSIILAFTVINEFENFVISKTEIDLFTALPVDDELIVYAKLRVILRYVFVISLPLLIPGSVYFFMVVRSLPRSILYFVSGFMLFYFLINVMLMIYCVILRRFAAKRLSSYVLIFQILLVFILVIGYQYVTYTFTGYRRTGIDYYFNSLLERGITQYFPQSWFALIPARQRSSDYHIWLNAVLTVVICCMSYLSLKYYLISNYSMIRERFLQTRGFYFSTTAEKSRSFYPGTIGKFLRKIFLRNSTEESSFLLVQSMFLRDRLVRLNILPMIAVPIGLAIFALLTNQLPPPIGNRYGFVSPVFHASIFITVLMAVNTAVRGVKVSADSDAAWIYDAFPIQRVKRFKNGIRKFFIIDVLVPISFLLFILFLPVMPVIQAVIHTLYIFACSNLYNSIYHLSNKDLPFSKDNTAFHSIERVTTLIYPIVFGVLFLVVQHYAYSDIILAIVTVLAIITVNSWVNYFGFVRTCGKQESITAQTI
jgi:hypothetical protein